MPRIDGMLGRLVIGIFKGLVVGGLLGFGLAKAGFVAPGALVAYAAAALTGVLVGLVAGKPIWAKDARIEAGAKAVVGALLGAGIMFALRRWATVEVPLPLGPLAAANESLGEAAGNSGTLGGLAITSLATVAALLGGFYEADNTPEPKKEAERPTYPASARNGKRIAAVRDEELEAEPDHRAPGKRVER